MVQTPGVKVPSAIAVLAALSVGVGAARADSEHLVRRGQTLARIARQHRISVSELAAANRMERDDALREGQVLTVPPPGVVFVRPGQTLSRIARNHEVSVRDLARQNRIRMDATLRPGQRLLLPGFEAAQERQRAETRWGRPRQPGVATFMRVWSSEKARIRLVDRWGRVRKAAVQRLRHLLRPKHSRKRKPPDRRLVRLLARISDHFGGRTIHVVSGYREAGGYTKLNSRHVAGKAIDFRIRDVPTKELANYCRKLPNVGVGYYPKSRFVHLDVRERKAFWTDLSGPGEPPRIVRSGADHSGEEE